MSMEALRANCGADSSGKGAVGIEIPNETRETVYFKGIGGPREFPENQSRSSPIALGKDIEGNAKVVDLARCLTF